VSLNVPAGSEQCPASGPGAACRSQEEAAAIAPGVASTPDGQAPCPASTETPAPSSPAACTDVLLPAPVPTAAASRGDSIAAPEVTPSVPVSTLRPAAPAQRLELDAGNAFLQTGNKAILTATANATMTGTNSAIEIFDRTTNTLAGACMQSSQCIVAYAAASGLHTFAAFITRPGAALPATGAGLASNEVGVTWLGISLASDSTLVAPGKSVIFTATSTFDVGKAGRVIVIYDNTTKQQITYCSRGTTCSTSMTQSAAGVHEIVGWVPGQPEAMSRSITATWLGAALSGTSTYARTGGTVHLTATANTDLTNTPWSLGIYDQHGRLVGQACKNGNTCGADITLTSGDTPYFSAVIGALPPADTTSTLGQLLSKVSGPSVLVDVQARSAAIQPTRILWGVDSCKAFTTTGADGLIYQVGASLGMPDFWGRYLTDTVCPGISSAEIALAAHYGMGILPIYNAYNCSNVAGYAAGKRYAAAATTAAARLGIPQGRALAIDIEPPGDACPGAANVDAAFIQGWYDGVAGAGYVPAYYGNGTAGSEFGSAWCAAVSAQPAVGSYSYLWSFEPSLLGSYNRASAPGYSPNQTGCAGPMAAWQYQISANSNPDVDHDEALSSLPLWYPH
jgi:glycoside hydrolase-like protein